MTSTAAADAEHVITMMTTTSNDRNNNNEWISKRVAKSFDEKLYFGFVTQYHPAAEYDNIDTDLFEVVYDDGDSEDMELAELQQCREEFLQNEQKDPQSLYLGRRIAQIFYNDDTDEDELQFGTVNEFVPAHETGEGKVWFNIVYDDKNTGAEDVYITKLRKMITLYNKNKHADGKKEDDNSAEEEQAASASTSSRSSKGSSTTKVLCRLSPSQIPSNTSSPTNDVDEAATTATMDVDTSETPTEKPRSNENALPAATNTASAAATTMMMTTTTTTTTNAVIAAPDTGVNLKKPPARHITPSPVHGTSTADVPSHPEAASAAAASSSSAVATPAVAYASNKDAVTAEAMQVLHQRFAAAAANRSSFDPHIHATTSAVPYTNATTAATAASGFITAEEYYHTEQDETSPIDIAAVSDEQVDALLAREEKTIDWKKTQKELDEMFEVQSREKMLSLPDIPMPTQFENNVSLTLFEYQKEGIRFLVNQETHVDATPPFYKLRRYGRVERWYCSITQRSSAIKPQPIRGSILADDMGLGKTIQTIGLMLLNPPKGHQYPIQKKRITGTPRCTLIVCPLSVMSNWHLQIDQYANAETSDTLKVATYHGPSRGKVLQRLGELDVLVTSYNTLASDFKNWEEKMGEASAEEEKAAARDEIRDAWSGKRGEEDDDFTPDSTDDEDDHKLRPKKKRRKTKPAPVIFDLKFHRIVLDEAHNIRNSETAFFKSIDMLESVHKLALTGTPFVNRPSDIQAFFSFIGVHPLCERSIFTNAVVKPITEKKEIGLARIRVAMSHVALRRTKAQVDSTLALVDKTVELRRLEFPANSSHKPIHDMLYDVAREAFIGLLREGTKVVYRNFFHLLGLILRVRMSCCHAGLVPPAVVSRMHRAHNELCELQQQKTGGLSAKDGEEILMRILEILKGGQDGEESSKECAVCFNEMQEGTCVALKTCKHIFCEDCLGKVDNNKCPFCRVSYSPADMIKKDVAELAAASNQSIASAQEESKDDDETVSTLDDMERPPKIQAMFDIIGEMAPEEKAVIFSQWTTHLDRIENALETEGHTFTRIDGSKKPSDRLDAIKAFSTEGTDSQETPRFILLSLHAAGTGLNLTRANVCIMMDCWWNVAVENQAIDRVHRIGQTRPVRAYRLIMKDTLEERMIKVQENKAALGKGSMQKLSQEERRLAKITALKDLFAVDDEDETWEGVYDDTYENDDPEWR